MTINVSAYYIIKKRILLKNFIISILFTMITLFFTDQFREGIRDSLKNTIASRLLLEHISSLLAM